MANNNDREPNTKKRGRPANKLTVKLFLLDPDHETTKVTKEICSQKAIEQLMQNGYGPPRPGNECIDFVQSVEQDVYEYISIALESHILSARL